LIHADKHGFLAIPPEDEAALLDAAVFMDQNECSTVIAAARAAAGRSIDDVLGALGDASSEFQRAARQRFPQK
jgi:hypothetical protein